jgi:hypothetical protein
MWICEKMYKINKNIFETKPSISSIEKNWFQILQYNLIRIANPDLRKKISKTNLRSAGLKKVVSNPST